MTVISSGSVPGWVALDHEDRPHGGNGDEEQDRGRHQRPGDLERREAVDLARDLRLAARAAVPHEGVEQEHLDHHEDPERPPDQIAVDVGPQLTEVRHRSQGEPVRTLARPRIPPASKGVPRGASLGRSTVRDSRFPAVSEAIEKHPRPGRAVDYRSVGAPSREHAPRRGGLRNDAGFRFAVA